MPSTSGAGPVAAVGPQEPIQNALTLVMTLKSPAEYPPLKAMLEGIQGRPHEDNPIWKALEKLNNVHFARFVFLENNTKLAVITTYDTTFDEYIADFTREIGGIFDALLAHMAGAPPLPVEKNAKAFLEYVRANDQPFVKPFYSAYPKATVSDIHRALEALEKAES